MSRSNNTEITNPSTRYFEFSGSEGKVKYYDKDAKENVFLDLPFTFLVLDTLTTIKGYSDEHDSGIWSNEIRNTKTDELTVRTKGGILAQGLYDQVKSVVGAKYSQSVYIAYKDGDELKIGNLQLHGAAIGPWIEWRKGKNIYDGAVAITGTTNEKKGSNKYFAPVFEAKPTSEETDAKAKELDTVLQEYLTAYFVRNGQTETTPQTMAATVGGHNDPQAPLTMTGTQDVDDPNDLPF